MKSFLSNLGLGGGGGVESRMVLLGDDGSYWSPYDAAQEYLPGG